MKNRICQKYANNNPFSFIGKGFAWSLFIVMSFTSCKTSMVFTTLDILRPAYIEFPANVENILIVNNTKIQPDEIGHSIQLLGHPLQHTSVSADSVSIFLLSVLTEEIQESGFFNSTQLILNTLNTNTDFVNITPLSRSTITNLFNTYHVDAIISLDHIVVRSQIQEHQNREWNFFYSLLDVRNDSFWSIHFRDAHAVGHHFQDSIFWLSESHIRAQALNGLPDRRDAIIDAALIAGHNSARRFVPHWEQADRFFYESNHNIYMHQAMTHFRHRYWENAIELWKQALNTTNNRRLKAQAANNIAITYEILGRYDEALNYAQLSLNTHNSRTIIDIEASTRLANYVIELIQRQEEVLRLNRQLGITNDTNP